MAKATAELFIYGLADPRTDVIHYIGKSKKGMRRPRNHGNYLLWIDHTPKGEWVRSLVADGVNYRTVVLEEASKVEDLDPMECFWIAQGRGLGWPLTNLTKGGKGRRAPHSSSTKQKIGLANSRPQTEEHRRKNSEGLKRHWASGARGAEYRDRLSKALAGKAPAAAFMKRTPEWKANMSRAQKERRQREREARERLEASWG